MKILQGIKVVDVTAWAFVPSAGGVMAHWGADVVKVESPGAPDPMRFVGGSLEPGLSSNSFKHYSRGKRSIGIDLATAEGRDLLYRMSADADVFLTSYLPATRRKLKIDVDDIRAVNPNIVYARGSGYGPKGPEAERPGYDLISWWYRGSLAQSTMDVSGATWPTFMVGHGDGMSGMSLAGGICAALLHRALTGETTVVDGSLMGTAAWFNGLALMAAQADSAPRNFGPVERVGPAAAMKRSVQGAPAATATMSLYQTKDYRFLGLCFLGDADRDFVDLCQHLERPELASDARFAHSAERVANSDELTGLFEDAFAAKTFEEWKSILVTAKGAWGPVQTPEEFLEDPQTVANGFLRHVDYPDGGVRIPSPPVLFDEDGGDPPLAPDFAQHTDEVLAELGCTPDDITRLRQDGIVV